MAAFRLSASDPQAQEADPALVYIDLETVRFDYAIEGRSLRGNLSFMAHFPAGNSVLRVCRSKGHDERLDVAWYNSAISVSENDIEKFVETPIRYRGTNIWISVPYSPENKDWFRSEKIYIDDYILPEDLEQLKGSSSVEAVEASDIDVSVSNGILSVSAPGAYTIELFDMAGVNILREQSEGEARLPVTNLATGLYIVRLATENQTIIKKLKIQS